MKRGWFITGTDTEIGKTLITGTLLYALANRGVWAAGMKPVAAGTEWRDGIPYNEDLAFISSHASVSLPTEISAPYLLRHPVAPQLAAALESRSISLAEVRSCYDHAAARADVVVVEGVGGFRVPLNETADAGDMAVAIGLPVILVVGMRLGCINHALLTVESILNRGLQIAGWVANVVDPDMRCLEENVVTLKSMLDPPFLGLVPRMARPSAEEASRNVDFTRLANFPEPCLKH